MTKCALTPIAPLNIYQKNAFPRGGEVDENEVPFGSFVENIDTRTTQENFPHNLVHQSIDDDPLVQARIVLRLTQLMFR